MEYTLEELLDIPKLRQLLDSLDEIHSMPSAIMDLEGNILTATAWQDICTKFHRINPETEKKCIESDTHIDAELHKEKPHVIYRCPLGLVDAATPIIIDGKHLGNVFTGQLFMEPPDEEFFTHQARQYGFDEKEYLEAMRNVPIFPEDKLHKNLTFIQRLTQMLANQGLQLKRRLEAEKSLRLSNNHHRSILFASLDGIWSVDLQGRFLEVNAAYCRMSGYSEQELLTMSISDVEAEESVEETALHLKNIISQGQARFLSRHRRKNGTVYDIEVSAKYLSEDGGQFVAFLRDITKSKQAERALHDSEAKLTSILRSAPIGIGQVTDRKFNFVNEQFAQMLGYSGQELIGQKSRSVYPSDEEFERVGQYKYEEIQRKGTGSIETIMQKKNGSLIDVFLSSTPVNQSDWSQGVTFTALDITDRKAAEKALKYQKNLLQKAQELGQIGSWEYDPTQNTFLGTEVGNQIYGIPNGFEAKYEMLLKRVHRDDRKVFDEAWQAALKHGYFDVEHRIVVNGTTKWVREKAELKFDENGKGISGIGFTQDITDRKQTEIALQESKTHLQMVFDNAPVALFQEDFSEIKAQIELLKQQGVTEFQTYFESHPEVVASCATKVKIIDVNRAALQLHKANTITEVLECLHRTFMEDAYCGFYHGLIALASGAESFHTEATVQTLDGDKREVLLHLFIDPNRSNWSCIYVSATDITDRKKAEEEHQKLEAQLRQKYKMEAVGVMAGGMAHNFNNNLSIILGNVELSKMKMPPNSDINAYLSNAEIAVLRSRDLVQQILTYSQKEGKGKTSTHLPLIIDETLQLLRATTPTTINLQQKISSDSHALMINADSSQIQECLINLCNNSMYAMEEEGDITITLERVELQKLGIPVQYKCHPGEYAKLSVQDTGCGMAAETVDKIFDLFFTTKPVDQGTGVGLSTVQGIVTQHGGLIKVNSRLGEGTTFELYFPVLDQTESSEIISVSDDQPEGTERILFVDDDPMLASLGEEILSLKGYTVTTMTDSTEALKKFTANPDQFDLVITDQTMPDLAGKELIQQLKKVRADIPTIICTGYSSKVNEDNAKDLGVSAFLMKPLNMPQLLQTVRRVLDGKEK
ncbi:MAG: PAS domain S-box protein [Desulfuromusa sp.]|jgi:PAS domain S-box-containing protein|nr:PAS domain S-box protein [Desulfuromusa sp.]